MRHNFSSAAAASAESRCLAASASPTLSPSTRRRCSTLNGVQVETPTGEWKVTRVEWPENFREPPTRSEIDGITVTVAGDRVTVTAKGEEADTLYVVFTEDATKAPKHVDLIGTEGKDSREPRKRKVWGPGKGPDGKPEATASRFWRA